MTDLPKLPGGTAIVFRFCGGARRSQVIRSDQPQATKEGQAFWAVTLRETVGRRLDVSSPNVPPAAALPTSDNRPVSVLHSLTIRLSDGSSIDIDQDEWPSLASPVDDSMRHCGQSVTEHLFVGKYDDGRTLVYVVIEHPAADKTIAGELLPTGSADVEAAVRRIAERFDISAWVVDKCLDSIKRASQ